MINKKYLPKNKNGYSFLFIASLVLIFFIFSVKSADAATLNVGAGQPYSSIQAAVNAAASGDTVSVTGGPYNEQVLITKSGISIIGSPSRSVTVDGTGKVGMYEGIFTVSGASNIKISGFKIMHSGYAGVGINGGGSSSGIIIENNYITDTQSSAVFAGNASNVTVDGNEITGAKLWPGGTENEVVSFITVTGFEIKNNWIHDNIHTESIDVKWGSTNGKIHHNNIKPIESAGIYLDAWNGNQKNNEVYDNIIHDGGGSSRGIAMAVECGGSMDNVKIYNNLVYNNGAHGIVIANYTSCDPASCCIGGPVSNIYITNNTVYNNDWAMGWGGGIVNEDNRSDAVNIFVRNNISYKNNKSQISQAGSNTTINNNFESDPSFVNAVGADFHLKLGSPAIDAGSASGAPTSDYDGNARPVGSGFDIGAYEYCAGPACIVALPSLCGNGIKDVLEVCDYSAPLSANGCQLSPGTPNCNISCIQCTSSSVTPATCITPSCNISNPSQYCSAGSWANCSTGKTCSSGVCCDLKKGDPCTLSNGCSTSSGTYQCDGSCNAPPLPPLPPNALQSCSPANACNQTNQGTYDCTGTKCSVSAPPMPVGYGGNCTSVENLCGQTSPGTVTCSGCDASAPALPPGFDDANPCTIGTCDASGNIYHNNSCGGLVPCGRAGDDPSTVGINEAKACNLCSMFYLLKKIINFIIVLSLGLAILLLIVAGYLYATAVGDQGRIELAKSTVTYTLLGLVLIFLSWLVIAVILQGLGYANITSWNQVNCAL